MQTTKKPTMNKKKRWDDILPSAQLYNNAMETKRKRNDNGKL